MYFIVHEFLMQKYYRLSSFQEIQNTPIAHSQYHGSWWPGSIRSQYISSHCIDIASGPRFNIKMSSYQHRKSHCGDKTVVRSSYLHNGISYTGKITSLYWISPQQIIPDYRQISNIRCTKSPNLNVSCLVLQMSLPNTLKPDVKLRMQM